MIHTSAHCSSRSGWYSRVLLTALLGVTAAAPAHAAEAKKSVRLSVLPGNYAVPLSATGAERVGNYALRIDWSDGHSSGIYSFQYLREITPQPRDEPAVGGS